MASFRWLLFALWALGSVVVSAFIGDILSWFDKPWPDMSHSILVPIIALLGGWILAPIEKHLAVIGLFVFGLAIAIYTGPSMFPVWHANAGQTTYLPVMVAGVTGVVMVLGLLFLSRQKKD